MQSRDTRFVLRIESGERQGEQVPLVPGTLQVGRRPECGLVLKDGSVSGQHAELRISAAGVQLVDLGSTNGTRVGGEKIEQAALSHGDALLFGNVRATLHDVELAGGAALEGGASAPPSAGAPGADTSALGQVSLEKVKRSRSGSRLLTLLIVAVLLAAGGALAYLRFLRPGAAEHGPSAAVADVPGNLVQDASFEEGSAEWSAAEQAPVGFARERAFASSGAVGLGARFEAEGWSLARSAEFTLPARRALAAGAQLRVDEGALGRFGVELSSSSGALPSFIAWTPARRARAFEPVELVFDVQGGYDRGRLVVAGRDAGAVALDDVRALEREVQGGAVQFTEYELRVLGNPGSTAMMVRAGRALIAGLDLSNWGRERLEGWAEATLTASATARGFRLSFEGAPQNARLRFFAVRPDAGEGGWAATTGAEGYAAHAGDFTRGEVTNLLLGSGTELLRLGFERPVEVNARSVEGALAFSIALAGLTGCELQLAFSEERAEASALADRAADAERRKDLGAALAAWTELLDRFPYERQLVGRATAARARLIQGGLERVDALRRELEQARFFLLPELFQKGEAEALALAREYRGSEVEGEAMQVARASAIALTELSAGDRSGAAARLRSVLQAVDPGAAPRLAAHIQQAIQEAVGAVDRPGQGD